MTEHVCEWSVDHQVLSEVGEGTDIHYGECFAYCKCGKELRCREIQSRLNEYETLKAATERLSAEYVRSLSNIDWEIIVDAIEDNVDVKQYAIRLWNRYDASAQRAYANILEGKDD